jgi:hypothetical protein
MMADHPYLTLYLVGCAIVVSLALAKLVLALTIGWISKANIVRKNLRKLEPREPFVDRVSKYLIVFAFSVALSWVNVVLMLLWEIPMLLFGAVREAFSAVPEDVRRLRFPLKNNSAMSPEAVWAHVIALSQVAGADRLKAADLIEGVDAVKQGVPSFKERIALEQLSGLTAIGPEVISEASTELSRREVERSGRDHDVDF